MSLMQYKGYTAKIEYSEDDKEFVGRVLGTRDVIGFHGKSVADLEKDFAETVDFYLDTCKKRGKKPDRSYSGKMNLRMPPEKHRVLAHQAEATGRSINEMILAALDMAYPESAVPAGPKKSTPTPRATRKAKATAR